MRNPILVRLVLVIKTFQLLKNVKETHASVEERSRTLTRSFACPALSVTGWGDGVILRTSSALERSRPLCLFTSSFYSVSKSNISLHVATIKNYFLDKLILACKHVKLRWQTAREYC